MITIKKKISVRCIAFPPSQVVPDGRHSNYVPRVHAQTVVAGCAEVPTLVVPVPVLRRLPLEGVVRKDVGSHHHAIPDRKTPIPMLIALPAGLPANPFPAPPLIDSNIGEEPGNDFGLRLHRAARRASMMAFWLTISRPSARNLRQ